MKKEKLSINTIIICITALVCTFMLSYAILKANRYALNGNRVVDKYNKTQEWAEKEY